MGAHIPHLDRITSRMSKVLAMAPSRQPLAYRAAGPACARVFHCDFVVVILVTESPSRRPCRLKNPMSREAALQDPLLA